MDFTPASSASVTAFLAVIAFVAAAVPLAVKRARASAPDGGLRAAMYATACVVAWIAGACAFVGSGIMEMLPYHGLPFFFGVVFGGSVWFGISRTGGRIAETVPLFALVGFQVFRLPLELVLHSWAAQGTIPGTMTWTGQNFDVFSGFVALAAMPFAARSRLVAWTANFVCFGLLVNVVRVAILSSPLPIGWGQRPTLQLALHVPYALIGPVCVGGAVAGHIILTRALLRKRLAD